MQKTKLDSLTNMRVESRYIGIYFESAANLRFETRIRFSFS